MCGRTGPQQQRPWYGTVIQKPKQLLLAIILGVFIGTSGGFAVGLVIEADAQASVATTVASSPASVGSERENSDFQRTSYTGSTAPRTVDQSESGRVQVSREIPAIVHLLDQETQLLKYYDSDDSGFIERTEAIDAVTDYLLELPGPFGVALTLQQAVDVVTHYLLAIPL